MLCHDCYRFIMVHLLSLFFLSTPARLLRFQHCQSLCLFMLPPPVDYCRICCCQLLFMLLFLLACCCRRLPVELLPPFLPLIAVAVYVAVVVVFSPFLPSPVDCFRFCSMCYRKRQCHLCYHHFIIDFKYLLICCCATVTAHCAVSHTQLLLLLTPG